MQSNLYGFLSIQFFFLDMNNRLSIVMKRKSAFIFDRTFEVKNIVPTKSLQNYQTQENFNL